MAETPRVLFCGGGSIGHLAPSLAVAEALQQTGPCECKFVCSWRTEELSFLKKRNQHCYRLPAPKFPRGITLRWIIFPFLFPIACVYAFVLLVADWPHVVFSKGGYVSVPVSLAAWVLRIPIVVHESDAVTGLGNSLLLRLASRVCHGFPMGVDANKRHVYTGNPVRDEMRHGDFATGLEITGFSGTRPILLVIGGSQGAEFLNTFVINNIEKLSALVDIVHITGRGKAGLSDERDGYVQKEFVDRELPHLYAIADLVITRAGAGTLSELAATGKPAIVVPLVGVAHDHQVKNAQLLASTGAALSIAQKDAADIVPSIKNLLINDKARNGLAEALHAFFPQDSASRIAAVLRGVMRGV